MSKLITDFIDFLAAIKRNDDAALTSAAANVMNEYRKGPAPEDETDKADQAVRKIIEQADASGAYDFLANLIIK